MHIPLRYFGKDCEDYTEQIDKLSYILTCMSLNYIDKESMINNYYFEHIQYYICSYALCKGIIIEGFDNGGLDHQMANQCYYSDENPVIGCLSEDAVLDFVYCPNYVLHTDCD